MAKMTLLELVQKVLVSINGDEVSSISDTVESMTVANIVEDVYFNLVTNTTVPEQNDLLQITGLSDIDKPNYMVLPTTVANISSFKYDNSTDTATETIYKDVKYLNPEEFLSRINRRSRLESNVQVVTDTSGVKLLIVNDKFPDYWTSFNDEHMIFDSFNNNEDSTLQASKSLALGKTEPAFTLSDSFVPDIDANLFPMLLNEVKSWAHLELRQQGHQKAEQQARRQRVTLQNDKERFQKGGSYSDYGRK